MTLPAKGRSEAREQVPMEGPWAGQASEVDLGTKGWKRQS